MKPDLLNYIVCPVCETPFSCEKTLEKNGEIIEGSLLCKKCNKSYPITKSVPRIIPVPVGGKQESTADAFGYQWKKFADTNKLYDEEFRDYLKPLTGEHLRGKIVLDAGCGNGRFISPAVSFNPKVLIAFDLSEAVDVAYENSKSYRNVHVIQGDIYNPPFKKNSFDFVYCIAVLHHLPDPKKGFLKLNEYAKSGGTMFGWVYGKEGNELFLTFIEPLRKYFTVHIPKIILRPIALVLAGILWLTVKIIYKPLNFFNACGFLPMNEYLIFQTNLGFRYLWLTTFDKLVAPVVHYHTRDEFASWFHEAKLKGVNIIQRNGNSWRGYGTKK